MNIVFTAKLSEKHQMRLQEQYSDLKWNFCESMEEALSDPSAQVLVTYGEDITQDVIERFSQLRWIQVLSAGVDKMPLRDLDARDIIITNARGIHRTPMAEYTIGVMLSHVRRKYTFYELQKQQLWDRSPRIDELAGKTLGILGAGAIGSEIARKAKAFDMHVIGMNQSGKNAQYFDEMVTFAQIDHMLSVSDFVVVVLPLTSETHNMIREEHFRQMKSTSVFINIARGAVIDERALMKALEEGWIAAAYLDVFAEEPLPQNHPLWTLPNCWITPHISGRSPLYMSRALQIFEHNLDQFIAGHLSNMINRVDTVKGY